MTFLTAIFVRPFTWTYLMRPAYSFGRYFVKASVVSYMWLSASFTGKSTVTLDMGTPKEAIKPEALPRYLSPPPKRLGASVRVEDGGRVVTHDAALGVF